MNAQHFFGLGTCTIMAVFLAACETGIQTTSGSQYLERYEKQVGQSAEEGMDPEIFEAANVEPILEFPARIGIARIESGLLAPLSTDERKAWTKVAQNLGPDWGEFVPISPLITAFASKPSSHIDHCYRAWQNFNYFSSSKYRQEGYGYDNCLKQMIRDIRVGAARQHVDAVLIYESFGSSERSSNPLAVTKLALIGFFLAPSEQIVADGYAQAVLLDVRNGYTYGYASATVEDADFTLTSNDNVDSATIAALERGQLAAVLQLTGEVEQMARDLRQELAEKRVSETQAEIY